jgi:cell division protein ZapA (FtsZ GTPase activity inhibitor)
MTNEEVEINIGNRHLVVEMPDLLPAEINALAQEVDKRMTDLRQQNKMVGDSSKIALIVALSFAADLEREREKNGSVRRASIVGRIIELTSPLNGDEEQFRAVLSQDAADPIRLRIPASLMGRACRAFIAGECLTLTGKMISDGGRDSFSVTEIADDLHP